MKTTQILASFIHDIEYSDLGDDAISEAKKCILDGIGTTVAGSRHQTLRILKDYILEFGGTRQSTTLGAKSFKTSRLHAALFNGVACHVLDFDDTHRILGGHPTSAILPVILALGEHGNMNGKDILTAFILGTEISCKIGRGVNPSHYNSGYHATSTIGVFGATVAAAKMLKLDHKEILHALGIAGSMSSGLKENFGTMTKSLHLGLASSNGIRAAVLAKKGFTASNKIIEGDMGFCNVLSKGFQLDNITKDLGTPWEIVTPGVARKKYPCCVRTHTAIEAVLNLVNKNRINYKDVTEIECQTDDTAFTILIHPAPETELEAKFSMPFCLAIALLEKDVFIDHFNPSKIKDPTVIKVMNKVKHVSDKIIISKGYEYRWTSKVTIRLQNGTVFLEIVEKPKGDPQNPLSPSEIVEKFHRCVEGVLAPSATDLAVERIEHLEQQQDISNLIKSVA